MLRLYLRAGFLLVILLNLYLAGPALAEPGNVAELEQRLLNKALLDEGDIPALVRLQVEARNGYALNPELALPDPWQLVLANGLVRMNMALLLENYEALRQECQRTDWLIALAKAMEKEFPPPPGEPSVIAEWEKVKENSQVLRIFARRKLRLLDPDELNELKENSLFSDSPGNRSELLLLAARAYLDQGASAPFEDELAQLKAYIEQPDAALPLQIGYHCVARHSSRSPSSLEDTLRKVQEVTRLYRPGARTGDDIYWITAGDELAGLARDILSTYHQEEDPARKEVLRKGLLAIDTMAYDWYEAAVAGEPHLYDFPYEVFFTEGAFEKRQGRFALYLTSEKLINFLFRYSVDLDDPASVQKVRTHLQQYQACRDALNGFWLNSPRRFFPVQGDFWQGSALHRLEMGMKVQQWILEPDAQAVPALMDEMLGLSPLEEALGLAVEWSDNLRKVDPEAVQLLLSRAQKQAVDYRLPAYALLLAQQRVVTLELAGRTKEAVQVAEQAIEASGDLVTPSTPVPGGRTMGDVVTELSEYVALQRLKAGDATSALQQLDRGEALKSALQLSKDATRSQGEAGAAMQQVRQARAQDDRLARGQALGDTSVTMAADKKDFLTSSRALQAKYPELYDRTLSIKPVEFPRLQKHLPEDVLLLQYFPTATKLYIFAVSRDNLLLKEVALSKDELDAALLGYLRALRRVSKEPSFLAASQNLYGWLIAPVAEALAGKSTILLVPSGRLNYLPFSSLAAPSGELLGDQYRMSLLGKSSDLIDVLVGEPEQNSSSMVVVADPAGDLPAARQEGEALVALFPGGVALYQSAATRAALDSGMVGHRYLHLATHGEIDPGDPSLNFLVLAGGEKLTSDDIFALPMESVQMVTLSACNTALGQAEPTASVVSLAESFWVTGPDTVVATLWAVNDRSTAVFMKAFYGALRDGTGKAEAIQKAQREVRANPEFDHPYFWSPFVLLGDWR